MVGKGLRAQRLPARTGREIDDRAGRRWPWAPIDAFGGKVFVEGEIWNAVSDGSIAKDENVEVTAVDGLTVRVRRST